MNDGINFMFAENFFESGLVSNVLVINVIVFGGSFENKLLDIVLFIMEGKLKRFTDRFQSIPDFYPIIIKIIKIVNINDRMSVF